MTKVCRTCGIEKSILEFGKARKNNDGHNHFCKKCRNTQNKLYYYDNKEKILNKYKILNSISETKVKRSKYSKKYRKLNLDLLKKKALEKQKLKRNEPVYKFKESIRNRIRNSINHNGLRKKSKTSEILGCSFDEFRIYIESKFESWMNWKNRGLYNGELNYGWDIDHIIPMSFATTEAEILRLNHYTNLQPLCSYVNRNTKRGNH